MLDQELSRLPERNRAVMVLCDLEGLTYDQAAQALGWPMGTVKSRLAEGANRLRSALIRRGVAPCADDRRGSSGRRVSRRETYAFMLLQSTVTAVMSSGSGPLHGNFAGRCQTHGGSHHVDAH